LGKKKLLKNKNRLKVLIFSNIINYTFLVDDIENRIKNGKEKITRNSLEVTLINE